MARARKLHAEPSKFLESRRLTLSVGVPFVNSSWASRDPISPFPGPRKEIEQNGRGIGDISVTSRYWVFDPTTHLDWNVATGVGLKAPTGNARAQDTFPGQNNAPNQLRYVDQSVQPGDGGWGLMAEAHAFKIVRRAVLFGSGSYLANPRNTNGTPSLTVARGGTPSAANWDRLVNSVPDQYFARLGGSVGLWKGFSAAAAWRLEGLRRYLSREALTERPAPNRILPRPAPSLKPSIDIDLYYVAAYTRVRPGSHGAKTTR